MTTMTVSVKNNADVNYIAAMVSKINGVANVKMQNSIEFERIHGLPYTHQERMTAICTAEEDILAGRVYSNEEVRAMFPSL